MLHPVRVPSKKVSQQPSTYFFQTNTNYDNSLFMLFGSMILPNHANSPFALVPLIAVEDYKMRDRVS